MKRRRRSNDDLLATAVACENDGRLEEAERLYRKLLRRQPRHGQALNQLGVVHARTGRFVSAAKLLRRAVAADDGVAGYHNNLGNVLTSLGRAAEAAAAFERALALDADDARYHNNLGTALRMLGRPGEAEAHYRRALALRPDFAEAYGNLGNALIDLDRAGDAAAEHARAVELKPDYAIGHNNLGTALKQLGRYRAAIDSYRRALAVDPAYGDALDNLGEALKESGEATRAIDCFRHAMAAGGTHANLLLALNYVADADAETVFAEHQRWGKTLPLMEHCHGNDRDPDRRLRIGYLSADFRRHSVAYFVEPLLECHDRGACEVFCYADVARPDAVTERLRGLADAWRPIRRCSDDDVCRRITGDGIDILVDLAGHTMGGRLAVFAGKPAPVQVTWLGYPNTTGLAAMDYRLTDAVADPEGAELLHTERLVRLPGGFLCYRPPEDAPPVTVPHGDGIRFASCNNLAKVTPPVIEAWAAILRNVPASSLFLKAKPLGEEAGRRHLAGRFAEHGIGPDRLEMSGWITAGSHLAAYGSVDIGLDTFPYNGTTTTCEALWMGVPVITVAGDRHAGRVGASLLGRVGLGDLIAATPAAYVDTAVALAVDGPRRRALRHELRAMMGTSGLTDGAAFAAAVEAAYRRMWQDWCAAAGGRSRTSRTG